MAFLIAPSILSADFARLGEDTERVLAAGADIVHFDVMDNHYVPNLTFGPMICSSLRKYGISAPIDVHLMVEPVDDLIVRFADAGANSICFHPEASRHVDRSIQLIIDKGCQPGIALNPATPLHVLDHIIHKLHFVLVMSVNPGFGGQTFIPETLQKIRELKAYAQKRNPRLLIEVDGGIKTDNIRDAAEAGASIFVAGSAIFNAGDYSSEISAMRQALSQVKEK